MFFIKNVKVRSYEKGLYFRDREFQGLLDAGRYWFVDPLFKVKVDVVSQRTPWIEHEDLDVIVKSGALEGHATVVDLKDNQRHWSGLKEDLKRYWGPDYMPCGPKSVMFGSKLLTHAKFALSTKT